MNIRREKQFYEMLDIVEDVNKYLKEIKIVDPAVGSGAFPMGILLEIVSMREYIEKEFLNKEITSYELKRETIQNSIYGVDYCFMLKAVFSFFLCIRSRYPDSRH